MGGWFLFRRDSTIVAKPGTKCLGAVHPERRALTRHMNVRSMKTPGMWTKRWISTSEIIV